MPRKIREPQKRVMRVFLCHATEDKPIVRTLYRRLTADGIDVWLDQEKLLPGQNWREEIPKAVKSSDIIIVCLTNHSITKEGYVQKEIKDALDIADEKPEGTIFIIPACLEKCNVPERLSAFQWVDLFTKKGYEKLMKSLEARANQLGNAHKTAIKRVSNTKTNARKRSNSPPLNRMSLVRFYKQPGNRRKIWREIEALRDNTTYSTSNLKQLYKLSTPEIEKHLWLLSVAENCHSAAKEQFERQSGGERGFIEYAVADSFAKLGKLVLSCFELYVSQLQISARYELDDLAILLNRIFDHINTMLAVDELVYWQDIFLFQESLSTLRNMRSAALKSLSNFKRQQAVLEGLSGQLNEINISEKSKAAEELESQCERYWGPFVLEKLYWQKMLGNQPLPSIQLEQIKRKFNSAIFPLINPSVVTKQSDIPLLIKNMKQLLDDYDQVQKISQKLIVKLSTYKKREATSISSTKMDV